MTSKVYLVKDKELWRGESLEKLKSEYQKQFPGQDIGQPVEVTPGSEELVYHNEGDKAALRDQSKPGRKYSEVLKESQGKDQGQMGAPSRLGYMS